MSSLPGPGPVRKSDMLFFLFPALSEVTNSSVRSQALSLANQLPPSTPCSAGPIDLGGCSALPQALASGTPDAPSSGLELAKLNIPLLEIYRLSLPLLCCPWFWLSGKDHGLSGTSMTRLFFTRYDLCRPTLGLV